MQGIESLQAGSAYVLNLIINGLPSKLNNQMMNLFGSYRFKPYYKWITF